MLSIQAIRGKEFDPFVINTNLTTNEMVSTNFAQQVWKIMGPVAPQNLPAVNFVTGGSGVEKAILTAMAERGQGNWTAIGFEA